MGRVTMMNETHRRWGRRRRGNILQNELDIVSHRQVELQEGEDFQRKIKKMLKGRRNCLEDEHALSLFLSLILDNIFT